MNKPIRVAQVLNLMDNGGIEAVVLNYYRFIDKSKIQFDFICCEDSSIPYEQEILHMGGHIYRVPSLKKMPKYVNCLIKIFKNNQYKIVHVHMNTLSIFPLFAANLAHVPVRICHNHSTTNKEERLNHTIKLILRPFAKIFATDYYCCSEFAGRWLFGNKEYDKGNVYLLNNAIDVDKFTYNEKVRNIKRKELNIGADTLVFGHIGRFVKQKNHSFLIDIFKEIHKKERNSILLLVGQGPLEENIKNKVKELGLDDSVCFLGQRKDVSELYQAFDVFVLPSLYEGLPVVGVEAQSSGLLCIFSNDMTGEAKILDTTKFLSLYESEKIWCDIILKSMFVFTRKNTKTEMERKKFSIKEEARKFEDKYFELLKKDWRV